MIQPKMYDYALVNFFFVVNLGFIRLRTASCVFALYKTAFIKIREYNLFKLKLRRTV